jgi:hypothetical protein
MRAIILYNPFVLIMIFLFAGACGGGKQQDSDAAEIRALAYGEAGGGIEFEMHRFLRESEGCQEKENRCARIRAEYPVAESGPKKVRQFINDTIFHYVVESLSVYAVSEEDLLSNLDSIAGRFIDSYEQYAEGTEDFITAWIVETVGEVLFQSSKVTSVALHNYSYTGGAHPNTYIYFLNFDRKRNKLLKIADIVSNRDKLKELVEKKFRQYHQVEEGADLNEAGFFWDKSLFLPANFAIEEKGLFLYYNSYEAAPYAVGPTEILIPWADLEPILAKNRIF